MDNFTYSSASEARIDAQEMTREKRDALTRELFDGVHDGSISTASEIDDLVNQGADLRARANIRNHEEETEYSLMHVAIARSEKSDTRAIVDYCIKKGMRFDECTGYGYNALGVAACFGSAEMARHVCNSYNVDNISDGGRSPRGKCHVPLVVAAGRSIESGSISVMDTLLSLGAKINMQDDDGYTALHVAANRNFENAKFLLQRGANPNLRDNEGFTPLHVAGAFYRSERPKIIAKLIEHGANPNLQDNAGDTPIMKRVQNSSKNKREDQRNMNAFLNIGASIMRKNKDGKTIIDIVKGLEADMQDGNRDPIIEHWLGSSRKNLEQYTWLKKKLEQRQKHAEGLRDKLDDGSKKTAKITMSELMLLSNIEHPLGPLFATEHWEKNPQRAIALMDTLPPYIRTTLEREATALHAMANRPNAQISEWSCEHAPQHAEVGR